MGDFSRNPDDRLNASVARHYVGVRLQQGVPLLDTDWNELEGLRRHELASWFQRFFGDGVPADNDGFHIEALAGGGVGTIVLEAADAAPATGVTTLEVDFAQSTAASRLGFLPIMSVTERRGTTPARLVGNAAEPFPLQAGLTFAVRANGEPAEVVTFAAADFSDIAQATAAEVVAVLSAGLTRATAQAGDGNDFVIGGGDGTVAGAGRIAASGVEAVNEFDVPYSAQPLYEDPALAALWGVDVLPSLTPSLGSDRQDLVYLDVWDREVGTAEDDGIVLPAVGVETAVRMRREWVVRVAEDTDDLSAVPQVPGHRYLALARLLRTAGVDAVAVGSFRDLRTRELNVARYLKTPILYAQGGDVVDADRFAGLLESLRTVLLTRLQNRVFDFTHADSYDEFLVLTALQDLAQQSAFAAVQTRAGTFNNADGLRFLDTLYGLQHDAVQTISLYGNALATAQTFIDEYTDLLDGAAGIDGLRPALDDGDFLAAVEAQEEINTWLSAPVDLLPEGDIVVTIVSVDPGTNLAFNVPFNITYRIESQLTSPQAQEAINLTIAPDAPATWDIALDQDQVVVAAMGGQDTVVATVTPRAGTTSVAFRFTATADRNPVITQLQVSDPFVVGQPPPTDQFLQWSAPPFDSEGRFAIESSDPPTVFFQVDLVNTAGVQRTFTLSHFVTPPAGEEADWLPVAASPASSDITVAAGDSDTNTLSLTAPAPPTVGSEGTLTIQATLIAEGGAPVVGGPTRTLDIPFIVVP